MAHPFISIIVAAYNCRNSLERLLESISKQSATDWELLVADGGSSDGTAELIRARHPALITWYKSARDGGIYDALNSAMPFAAGDWILVLGADDLLPDPGTLERVGRAIRALPDHVAVCYGNIEIEHQGRVFHKDYPGFEDFSRQFGSCPPIHHQSLLVRRSRVVEAGGFDARYKIHADYDLVSRLIKLGPARKIDCVVARFSDSGMSGSPKNAVRSMREFWIIRKRLGLNPLEKRWARRYAIQTAKILMQMVLPPAVFGRILAGYRRR